MADISSVLSSTKVALEQQASSQFGAAVEDFTRGTLGLPGSVTAAVRIPRRDPYTWYASSYAAALAGGTNFRPKLKFLFKIEFIFTPEARTALASLGIASLANQDFTFMVKAVDRPKIDFEYEDDINKYNFRTKVLKKIRHRELTVTFMDDAGNRVFDFFRGLMFLHSPITKRAQLRDNSYAKPDSLSITEGNGMAFTSAANLASGSIRDIAHRGVINSFVGGSIASIRVKQMFMDSGQRNIGNAPKQVSYDFLNPRIVSFDLDDLSHESSDANLLTMQFDYDWLEMVKMDNIGGAPLTGADSPRYTMVAPNVTNAPSDILSGGNAPTDQRTGANPLPVAGGGNAFINILANNTAKASQVITSGAINRAVTAVAGNGPFATSIAAGFGALGAGVNGIVGAAAKDLITGATSSAKSSYSANTRPIVVDSNTFGNDDSTIVRSTDGTAY